MSRRSRFMGTDRSKLLSCFWFSAVSLCSGLLFAQVAEDNLLLELMKEREKAFENVLNRPAKHRVQILYTQIDRNDKNEPRFKSYTYGVSPDAYFYPASTVKIFGAALALEKINQLNINGLDLNTSMRIDSSFSGQTAVLYDSTAASGKPSLGHYIKKLLVLSDNDAYNRTYEFLGQEALNEKLRSKGYDKLRLTHRLSIALSEEENRNTNAMQFYLEDPYRLIYEQGAVTAPKDYFSDERIVLGERYVRGDSIVSAPMDFSKKNYCSVAELQQALKSLIFPESIEEKKRFDLTDEDLLFLRTYMSQLPRETRYPDYTSKPDNYCKFFMYGDDNSAVIPDQIRIFNKIGLAYGFCIDNAYIVDFKEGIEFMLTAVIYANENNTLNDGNYEYETVAFPFLAELGRAIYAYELKRPRPRKPDLSDFKLEYDISGRNN